MASRLGSIERITVEELRRRSEDDKIRPKDEQLEKTSELLRTLMPCLWDSAECLLRLTGGMYEDSTGGGFGMYEGSRGGGFSVKARRYGDDRISLPIGSFIKKAKEPTRLEEGKGAERDKFRRDPIVVLYTVGEDGRGGDKYLKSTRLVGENGCYDTKLAVQGEDGGNWQFERGIGLKRRRRALGVAAAMLGRVERVIASIEGGVYDSCSEETEPVSIEDVLDNTEMVQDTSGLFVPAESGWHTGSSCNKRYPVTLHSRPLESL